MASMARLLILLSIASPMLAITEEFPEVFPSGYEKGTHIQAVLEQIKRSCPPFGNPDERFTVTVLGSTSPAIGGCASMEPPNPDILPSFNLWLGNHKSGGGGKCSGKNMDHFLFECMAKHPFFSDEDTLEGWYVMLYDRTARLSGRQDYRCALYETLNEDPPMIKMVISANQSCQGLSKRMKQSVYTVPKGLRHFSDGSIALQFQKDLPEKLMWRKKRSELQGGGCRFPDWSQGSWTDLEVDGSQVRYDSALHENDDVEYSQESNYGKDAGTETTDGEQYRQRSQRKKRGWWRETKTTTTEPYRDMQFENPPKKGDPMEPFSKTIKFFGTTHSLVAPNRKRMSVNENLDDKYKYFTTTLKYSEDLNNQKSNFPFDFYQLRKKRELDNQHNHTDNNTKNRQKRCWGTKTTTTTERYRDMQFENPPKKGDPMEPFSKTNKYFGTTQNPAAPNRKKRFINENLNDESESIVDDEEAALEKVKITDEFNRFMRWQNVVNAILTIKHEKLKEKNSKNEYEVFPEDEPVPPPIKYLKFSEIQGIPFQEALMNWRSLERAYRQKVAEVAYTTYPGENHPDIIMRDFDQTFDGIEYDFNPLYPEGTDDDPTAYRALTLPGGYHIEPRLSRRTMYEEKRLHNSSASAVMVGYQVLHSNSSNNRTNQKNTPSLNQRMKRSSTQQNRQQRATTTFSWRCEMPVDNDEKYLQQPENGAKFLTYGGRIGENNVLTGNDQHNENYSKNIYSCLWLVPRGPNILEYSIIGTGMPSKNQSMQTFAQQLCSETRANGKDTGVRNEKTLQSRRPLWVTVTRYPQEKLVPTRCPVSPGIVFYGLVPAPPPPSTVATNKAQSAPLRLCAKLVSSADDCATGQVGPADQMKYTVSECVDQDSSTGTAQTMITPQTIFEASGGDTVRESWRRNKRHSTPSDTSTATSSITDAITSTPSNMPILQFSSRNPSTGVISNITNRQTTGSTATFLTAMNSSSTISNRNGIQPSIDITTMDPTNVTTTTTTTTTTSTTFSSAISSTLPLSLLHETTSIDRKIPSLSTLSTTATSPSTSTATVPTTSSYHLVTDYHYRPQQQWQQQPQQSNNNNNDYYYRGRQQYYPPTPPGNIGTDNNYYYFQQQQYLQTQPYWLPQQHPITANDYSNSNQRQTMDSGGHRTGNNYYRQQQQIYDNHQYNNDQQQQTLQPPYDSSLALQHPNSGSWNVRGDRPLYIRGGGGGDNNRNAQVAWNSSSKISSSNNGGWTTAAQQYWWYQQQQRQQEQQQQKQLQQQQLQNQQLQQQNNRGLGGILSLPPVPLPPLHAEQGTITVSMPTPLPLHPRRQQKPSNHYYLPTLTTKTSSQLYQLQPKSESRYYQEREYQCLGQWTEPQQQMSPVAGEKSIMLTYTYLKRLNPITKERAQYECFVGTPIPNDEGLNPETTTTILLTEAGTNKCSRLSDPYRSGMKLVGTKIKKEGACKGSAEPAQDTASGSWYSLKPQQISPSIPDADNGRGSWYAAHPVPVVAQAPTTMMPILKGRHTGGNGATFTSRQNEQTHRPTSKTNHGIRNVADKIIVVLLAVILITGQINNIAPRFFN